MTDTAKAWIEETRALTATAKSQGEYTVAAVTSLRRLPRALDALQAVLKVHSPGDVFAWAEDCADPENHHLFTDVRTGDMLCEDEPLGRFCNGCVPENDTTIDIDEYPWPCATARAIEGAIMIGNPRDHYKTCEICNHGGHVCPRCGTDIPHKRDNFQGCCWPCWEEALRNA